MIRPIKIKLNAAHPELPLVEATTFVGSPSTVFVCDVPKAVGSWRISTVKVVAHYPDDSATTVECVKGADGVYTATLPATATSGRVTHGFEVLADAIDENGDPVTGYVLGFADFAVYTRDMTIESGGTVWYMHYFDAVPQTPKKGDVAPDGSGGLQFYNGTAWQPFAVVPPIQYPVTSVNGKTGAVQLSASDVGALGNTGNQTLEGSLSIIGTHGLVETLLSVLGEIGIRTWDGGSHGVRYFADGIYVSTDGETTFTKLSLPNVAGTLALLADMYAAVQQIAPDFTAKAYALNDLCSYNGVVYRCKSAYTATAQSTKPNADTTHWVAKKVSELFLPLTGGEITGTVTMNSPLYMGNNGAFYLNRDNSSNSSNVLWLEGGSWVGFIKSSGEWTIQDAYSKVATLSAVVAVANGMAAAFSANDTYDVGELCIYRGELYRCTTAVETAGAWTGSTNWTKTTISDILALLAPLASPAFTDTPTAPTPTAGDNSTKVATTAFVQTAVGAIKTFQHDAGGYYIEVEAS